MVTPVPVMSINLFLFLTSEHPIYFQSTPSKQGQILKTNFTLPLTFFPLPFPTPDFLYLPLLHVFPTAWDPSSWHVRASWHLNIITLGRAWSYLSYSNLWMSQVWKTQEWCKNGIFGNMFQLVFRHKVTEKCKLSIDGQLVSSKPVT